MPLSNPAFFSVPSSSSSIITASTIPSSIESVLLLAGNPLRKGATIWNKSTSDLCIEFAATASLSAFTVKISADGYYEVPFGYTGAISGIWETADGNALIREFV